MPGPLSKDAAMTLTAYRQSAALYYDAQRALELGDLEVCRDQAEQALLLFLDASSSQARDAHVVQTSPPPQDSTRYAEVEQADLLFADVLMLLSQVYSAAWAYQEADRLLATAAGYIQERFAHPALAMAAVSYNRGVLRLEQCRLTSLTDTRDDEGETDGGERAAEARVHQQNEALVREAKETYLEPAAAYLVDVVGPGRVLLSDVLHSLGTCCVLRGEWADALQHFQRSLDVRVRSYHALGKTLRDALNDDGRKRPEKLCALRPHLPRKDTTELKLALTLQHIGQLYHLMAGDAAAQRQSVRCLSQALDTRRRWLAPGHRLVLETCLELAEVASEVGEKNRARAALSEVIDNASVGDEDLRECALRSLALLT